VQKYDPLSLGPDAWSFIDELNARGLASLDHCVEIVDRKADVMDTRSAFRQKARDRRGGIIGLQQLHEGLSGAEANYAGAVGVIERDFPQPQYVPEKWKNLGDGLYRDSNVGYARATRG
jgi:hypothetical protein